jgi:hypothetical protein
LPAILFHWVAITAFIFFWILCKRRYKRWAKTMRKPLTTR